MPAKLGSEPLIPESGVSGLGPGCVFTDVKSWNRLFHGSLVKPVIFHQRWPLPASPELLKEVLKGCGTSSFLGRRGNSRLLCRENIVLQSGRGRKKKWDSNCHGHCEHYNVVSAGDEHKLQSSVGGCFLFSFSSHIVKLNGSQMSVRAFLWLQEETKETRALLQNFCTCTCIHTVHIKRVRLDAHTGSRWVTPGPANCKQAQLFSRDEELERNLEGNLWLFNRNNSHTESFVEIIYADLLKRWTSKFCWGRLETYLRGTLGSGVSWTDPPQVPPALPQSSWELLFSAAAWQALPTF